MPISVVTGSRLFGHTFEQSTAPNWASTLTPDAWTQLNTVNVFMDVAAANVGQYNTGGPEQVYEAFNGGALVSVGTYGTQVFWGGGHQDYYGNEVYVFDYQTLTFSRLTEPSTAGNATSWGGPFTNGILSDGTPNAAHSYYFAVGRGSVFYIGRRQTTNTPGSVNMLSWIDIANPAGGWTNSTASSGLSPNQGDGMCMDTSRDIMWMVECDFLGWASWDFGASSWTTYTNPANAFDPSCGPIYVPGKDAVLLFTGTNVIRGLDPTSPTSDSVAISTTGTGPTFQGGDGAGWSENLGAIVYYPHGGDALYTLTPPVGDWRSGQWTWAQLSLTGTSGNHTINGVYTRFQIREWEALTVAMMFDDPEEAPYAVRLS